jgi:UDP-2-acetamido-3-amino-2,3-dideoxy-glucuronate N-acetyltransferase
MSNKKAHEHPDVMIHESSYVDDGCEIGAGTKIWHFSHVMTGARIGEGCNIGQNVVISPDVVLGRNVKIQNNVSIYTGVTLEDDVFCGPSMVFTNVVNPRSAISRKDEYRQTRVKRGASMGANCTVVCGHDIGRYAFLGAGAVVVGDVPDYALMVGVPARRIGWICRCGVRLAESGEELKCRDCGNRYREADERLERIREVQDQ